jgi:hypothetical protein
MNEKSIMAWLLISASLILIPSLAVAKQGVDLNYAPNENLSNGEFLVFTIKSGSTGPEIGCSVFRQEVDVNDGRWISLDLLRNHILMIITPNYDNIKGIGNVSLYLGDTDIIRSRRAGRYLTYYMKESDYDKIKQGASLKARRDSKYFLLKSEELNRADKLLNSCSM